MADLKDMMAAQEMELTSAGAARDAAKQGRQCLEVECQRLCSAYGGESLSTLHRAPVLSLCSVMNRYVFLQGCTRGRFQIRRRRRP